MNDAEKQKQATPPASDPGLAAELLKRAKEAASGTNKTILLWVVALSVAWLFGIETTMQKIDSDLKEKRSAYDIKEKALFEAKAELHKKKFVLDSMSESDQGGGTRSTNGGNSKTLQLAKGAVAKAEKDVSTLQVERDKLFAEVDKIATATGTIPFEVIVLKTQVPTPWAPTLWCFLVFVFVWQLSGRRRLLQSLYVAAARACGSRIGFENCLVKSSDPPPWWVAPFSCDPFPSSGEPPLSVCDAMGIDLSNWRATFRVASFHCVLLLVQFKVAWIGLSLVRRQLRQHAPGTIHQIVIGWSIALTAYMVYRWFFPSKESSYVVAATLPPISRRAAMQVAGALILGLAAYSSKLFRHAVLVSDRPRRPRFVTRPSMKELLVTSSPFAGFVINRKSQVVFYAASNHAVVGPYRLSKRNLKECMLNDLKCPPSKPRVTLQSSSISFEIAALESLRRKEDALACKLLYLGVCHDLAFKKGIVSGVPSWRLFDLLVCVAVRFNHQEYLQQATNAMSAVTWAPAVRRAATDRMIRWQRSKGKLAIWRDRTKPVKWKLPYGKEVIELVF